MEGAQVREAGLTNDLHDLLAAIYLAFTNLAYSSYQPPRGHPGGNTTLAKNAKKEAESADAS